jgi:ADP-ribose pyrophosphatase
MLKPFETVSSEELITNPYWSYHFDRYILPDGKNQGEYHYVHSNGATLVIPVLENGDIVMVEQFRYLNRRISLEFPGGGLRKGMDPVQNALAELHEETGYKAGKIVQIGHYNPYNGVSDEICYVYVAQALTASAAHPEVTEDTRTVIMSVAQIITAIQHGRIWDGMSLAAWALYSHSAIQDKAL